MATRLCPWMNCPKAIWLNPTTCCRGRFSIMICWQAVKKSCARTTVLASIQCTADHLWDGLESMGKFHRLPRRSASGSETSNIQHFTPETPKVFSRRYLNVDLNVFGASRCWLPKAGRAVRLDSSIGQWGEDPISHVIFQCIILVEFTKRFVSQTHGGTGVMGAIIKRDLTGNKARTKQNFAPRN